LSVLEISPATSPIPTESGGGGDNRPVPNPPLPVETHRKRGTFREDRHGRKLPVLLPGAEGPPDPPRPLGLEGRRLWDRIWSAGSSWLAPSDVDVALMLAETVDERVALRLRIFKAGEDADWHDRVALRSLDAQVTSILSLLGFTPTDRSRLGVAEVRRASALDEFLARRGDDA
jgi:hypothetical protein